MPTKEQKPLLGTKGTRQGPQTLADLSTPLLIWVSYTKERNTGHRHPLRGDQQVFGGFTNMNASQLCGYTPYWKEERERREFLKGEDYKGNGDSNLNRLPLNAQLTTCTRISVQILMRL